MAQWLQQFSGLTHATKVADLEAALSVAASAFHNANETAKATKSKAVRKLAGRLLAVRLKALKAQRIAVTSLTGPSKDAERIRVQEEAVAAAGIDGILSEFQVVDAAGN